MSVAAVFTIGILGFLFIVGFMLWLTNRVSKTAITSYFQDAEYILEHHRPPEAWRGRKTTSTQITPQHLTKLDNLMRYFETSPFVADEDTRTILLESLGEERTQWQRTAAQSS